MIYAFYILASSLWCLGLFVAALPENWFNGFSNFMERWYIGKPIITCVSCMPSIHTAIVMTIGHYLIGVEFNGIKQAIGLYLICVPAVAFLNTFLWVALTKLST